MRIRVQKAIGSLSRALAICLMIQVLSFNFFMFSPQVELESWTSMSHYVRGIPDFCLAAGTQHILPSESSHVCQLTFHTEYWMTERRLAFIIIY